MPKAFVGFDSVVPFVTCLKEHNICDIHCIFLNRDQFLQFESIPVYEKVLKESASMYILKSGSLVKSFYNISNIFIRFLLALKPRIITIGGETKKGKIRQLIQVFAIFKGRYYVLPNYNAPMTMEFFDNYYTKALCDQEV